MHDMYDQRDELNRFRQILFCLSVSIYANSSLSFCDFVLKLCTRSFIPKKLLIYWNRQYRTTMSYKLIGLNQDTDLNKTYFFLIKDLFVLN